MQEGGTNNDEDVEYTDLMPHWPHWNNDDVNSNGIKCHKQVDAAYEALFASKSP